MSAHKPADHEAEYFAREEYERKKAIEEEKHEKMAEGEKAKLKEIHYMKCPKCGMDLVTIDYKGIQIDRCSG
ncbi:MAG: zf-TFIIB domain-containing protein, partial [Thermodesulfovibrionales bacterium]|nr:zf-TFIIB domain-containing protein [Thermodesulfovibrionales bacterium]